MAFIGWVTISLPHLMPAFRPQYESQLESARTCRSDRYW